MSLSARLSLSTRTDSLARIVIALYLVVGALYAVLTPPWQVPDEPAHYNYVRYVAEHNRLPELRQGDYPAEYLEEIKARRFPPEMSVEPIRYESHQPPLYYVLAALVYRLCVTWGIPLPLGLRAFSLLLGAVALWIGYRLVCDLFPDRPGLALGALAFAAFLPMHLAMTAAVNNDVLSDLLLNLIVWRVLVMRAGDWSPRRALALGALLGLAFLTKMQSYVAFGVAFGALAWDLVAARREPGARLTIGRALGCAAIMLGTSLVIAAPWLARNVLLYGPGDPLGLARHDQVVAGQLTTSQYIAEHGVAALARAFLLTTFRSFWGQFGWMGVVLPERIYLVFGIISALALVGTISAAIRILRARCAAVLPWRGLALGTLWVLITMLGYLWWNTKYLQHQGRYLFPAIIPIGCVFALGLREITSRSQRPAWATISLLTLGLLIAWAITGDLKSFALALLVAAAGILWAAGRIESRLPGSAQSVFYVALAMGAVILLLFYIAPALQP